MSERGICVKGPDHPLTTAVAKAVDGLGSHDAAEAIDVIVHEGGLAKLRELNRDLVRQQRRSLVVREEMGTAIIGPWLGTGRAGCHACLLARKAAALSGDVGRLGILRQLEEADSLMDAGWISGPGRSFVAALVAKEVAAMMSGGEPQALEAILTVRLNSLDTRCRRFLPNPFCSICGRPELDRPEAALLELRAVPKPHPRHYRALASAAALESVDQTHLDSEYGVLTGLWRPSVLADDEVLPLVSVATSTGTNTATGHGRAIDDPSAKVIAICEALERYGGLRPPRRTQTRGSFAELAADAIDPQSFGLPPAPPEGLDGSPEDLVPYSPDLMMSWVWAFSFARGRPVLVPEQIAYYGAGFIPPLERFVTESSNGCALGGAKEEAILHGLLEVAERDAFLMTWYARLPAPRIDLASITDQESIFIIERFQRTTGYRVEAFNITPPEKIPCIWVMAVDESKGDRPRTLCLAGASLDPERALRSALYELAPLMVCSLRDYAEDRERALRMLACPDEVIHLNDHRLVNALPEAWPRFGFLPFRGPSQSLQDAFPRFYQEPPEMDLTVELRGLIAKYLDQGLDVLVVDQTAPEHRRVGVHCVKVIVPGTLPMTFGHRHRRPVFDRLRTAPVRLGYRSQPITLGEINCDPHPFP